MRIAYLINEYPKVSHSFVRREIEALERRGVEVEIFSIRPWSSDLTDPADRAHADRTTVLYGQSSDLSGALRAEARTNGRALSATTAKAMKLAKGSEKSPAYWSAYVAEAARLRQLLVERKIDHLHAHFGTNSAAVAMLCRMLGGPSYSFTVHGPEEFDRQVGLSLTEKIEHAAFVVGISSYGRSQLLRLAPADRRDDIHVIHCGLSSSYLESESGSIGSAPALVTVGRLSEQKGHWVLLDAARMLAEDGIDFSLQLVGDGELRPEVEATIAAHGLEDHVEITGWATEDEVADAIRASRALVLPSFAEGLPVVIMEALALRRPVISTYVAGIPELVSPGECGWLVPAGDASKLASAMRAVLAADPAELDRFGSEGADRVAQMHNVDLEAAALIELFTAAIETNSTPLAA
jgi:glycosyltransferase involved in cell wall biosynthesis